MGSGGGAVVRWRPGELAPWAGTEQVDEDEKAAAETEVTEFGGRTFGTLSGGQRARAVLARRTPVLLLDESARAGAGARVLAVPHDLNLAAASALTSELLTNRCRREVEVQAHPRSGTPPVLPVR